MDMISYDLYESSLIIVGTRQWKGVHSVMAYKYLVIVESPAKPRQLRNILDETIK